MTTYQEQAETYVRQQLPELMELSFGCEVQWTYQHALNPVARTPITKTGHIILPNHMIGFGRGEWVLLYGNKQPKEINKKDLRIIGHPIQLQHWLTAINLPPNSKIENYTDNRFGVWTGKVRVFFDRKSGQPATEADYQAFCEIVGIKQN